MGNKDGKSGNKVATSPRPTPVGQRDGATGYVAGRGTATCSVMFPYEKWKVYRLALELCEIVTELSTIRVRGCASDLEQLRRATSSVLYNIGEGALHQKKGKKLESYRIALASAGECNAALTVLHRVHPKRRLIEHARSLCDHIAALLTNLIASVDRRYT
jgi:four helix bundle protein